MRRLLALALLVLLPAIGWADVPLKVHGETKTVQIDKVVIVKEDRTVVAKAPFVVYAPAGAFDYRWTFPASVTAIDKGDKLEVTSAPRGDVTFSVIVKNVLWEEKRFTTDFGQITFSVGDVGPTPPVPPGPTPPGPIPPGPTPPTPPGPAPIPTTGLRVLIVFESKDLTKYTPAQKSILYGDTIRSYLTAKCAKGTDGVTPEARFFDKDQNVANESPVWQEAMKRTRGQLPWILISTGTEGFEGPLPATVEETMTLLKRYGGQ
jgi:hypothetical protein